MRRLKILFFLLLVTIKATVSENSGKNVGERIINGELASQGQFPWQAALFFQLELGINARFCSGTIISREWILTAGHCVYGTKAALVYTGTTDISDCQGRSPTVESREFIIHESFNSSSLANDIALIKLPERLVLDNNTQTIALSPDEIKVGTAVILSGWGQTTINNTLMSPLLNYLNLITISNEQCQEEYGTTGVILPEMVCAATSISPLQSPCHGDSGGPVVIDFDTNPRHVAVASFVSDRGCESGFPSGYTRTSIYMEWIKEKTEI